MIDYTSINQLKIEEFKTPFELKLDSNNRWAKLSAVLPWDELAKVYYKGLQGNTGRKALDARIAIGAMVIKHKLNLSDRETVATIQENPYMQYFLGLNVFYAEPLFDPSLFVSLRKRMGKEKFDTFNQLIIEKAVNKQVPRQAKRDNLAEKEEAIYRQTNKNQPTDQQGEDTESIDNQGVTHGRLQMDATVSDIYIKYPTDLDLLNTSREWSEKIIDILYDKLTKAALWQDIKPRTYRKLARKEYLNVAKKKRRTKKELRRAIKLQLNYLKRNFGYIEKMLDTAAVTYFPLDYKHQRYYWVIQEVYRQQHEMFREKKNKCDDRIVSVHQPYIRPIVRGKSGSPVEFGPKLGLTLDNGYTRINTFSWDAYNEGRDLISSVEAYRKLHGYYPELVQADRIYATRENREWLKQRGIRLTAKALGRPKQEKETPTQKKKHKQERAERNQIEGKIGQGKNGYRMNQIRTRRKATGESWIACIIFVMNLVKMEKEMLKGKVISSFALFYRWLLSTSGSQNKFYFQYRKKLIFQTLYL